MSEIPTPGDPPASDGDRSEPAVLMLAPYLPLHEACSVGDWDLLPFKSLGDTDRVPGVIESVVSRLVTAYKLPSGGGSVLGAVAVPLDQQVGTSAERSLLPTLSRALLAGVLSSNPQLAIDEDEREANAGHASATSENAVVYGHPLVRDDSYVIETGVLVRVTEFRSAEPGEAFPPVVPPAELPKPLFSSFDKELADATYRALSTDDASARRLRRALDWYRLALSNSESVTLEARVGAARSAFEVLTDEGETKRLVRAYGRLVGEDETATTYDDVEWAKGPVSLTPVERWMSRLCELRNAIVHGDEVSEDLWLHEGQHQLNHIHDQLITVLRVVVSTTVADPLLLMSPSERVIPRLAQEYLDRALPDICDEEGIDDEDR